MSLANTAVMSLSQALALGMGQGQADTLEPAHERAASSE